MKKQLAVPTMLSQREFVSRGRQILQEIQKNLMPLHGRDIIALNVETCEYVLAKTADEAWDAFHARWPGQLAYVIRVDGGPVAKFHGK